MNLQKKHPSLLIMVFIHLWMNFFLLPDTNTNNKIIKDLTPSLI